jgi:hypothetical protein
MFSPETKDASTATIRKLYCSRLLCRIAFLYKALQADVVAVSSTIYVSIVVTYSSASLLVICAMYLTKRERRDTLPCSTRVLLRHHAQIGRGGGAWAWLGILARRYLGCHICVESAVAPPLISRLFVGRPTLAPRKGSNARG